MMNDRDKAKEQLANEVTPDTLGDLKKSEYEQYLQQKTEQGRKILSPYFNTLTALVYALEAKDKYTGGHSRRVANIAVAMAQELGLPPDRVDKIGIAGLIHDIGKIGVRDDVLNKPGKLTDDEYQHVISHCEIGERILSPIIEDKEILDMVRHHHEHYDGTGYPDGLSGKQIPLTDEVVALTDTYTHMATDLTEGKSLSQNASILAVADAYDAMTSPRAYRGALSRQEAADQIRGGAGTQFDPEAAEALLRIHDSQIPSFKEADKQAYREDMQLAEEMAKRAVEEVKKAEEESKQAREEGTEIYKGNIYLLLPSPVGFEQFKECLERIENLRILWSGGSANGAIIGVKVQKPMTLVSILNEMPMVEKVNIKKDKKNIVVVLKDTT